MTRNPPRIAVAYREAGHAVAHLVQALPVHRVTLSPGYCDHGELFIEQPTPDELFKHAVCALAGPAASLILCMLRILAVAAMSLTRQDLRSSRRRNQPNSSRAPARKRRP